jgi:4-hydroxy-tetrahydrodipicolinate synthase
MDIINNRPADLLVLSGDDALTYPFMALGMEGVISVIGNAYPKEFSSMVNHCLQGNWNEAKALHYKLLALMETIFDDGSPGGIKVILNKMGLCENVVRLPLANVNPTTQSKLLSLML